MENQKRASSLSEQDYQTLENAVRVLENPGFAARITDYLGIPIEKFIDILPKKQSNSVGEIAKISIEKALRLVVKSMNGNGTGKKTANTLHKVLATATGAVGGFFGLPALAIELPLTTGIMLRSIADIARSEGEAIASPETKLACLAVFALGGKAQADDAADSGYYAIRALLANAVKEGAPVVIKLITTIASRFGVTVTEKAAASAIPIVGAIGGASINLIFMDHFQDMARGHFIVRRLERGYDPKMIEIEYNRIQRSSILPAT